MRARHSCAKFAICSIVIACIVGLALGVAFGLQTLNARRELRAELNRIETSGEPTAFAQLAELYPQPPKGEDATPLWLAATRELDRLRQGEVLRFEDVSYPSRDGAWPDMDGPEQLLAKYRGPLNQFYRAAEHGGGARFPIDFSTGGNAELPHGSALSQAAVLLAHEAALMARRRDAGGMVRAILAIFAIGRSLENEPILITQFVRVSCNNNALIALSRLLPLAALSDNQLIELRQAIQSIRYDRALRLSVLSERVLAIELLLTDDSRNSVGLDEGDRPPPPNGWRLDRIRDLTYYLDRMRPLVEASALRGASRRSGIESADFALSQLFWPSEDSAHPWTVYLARPISSMIDSCFLGEARALAADAALAVLLYRRATGQTPRQFAELVPAYLPAVPLDPFNGEPLRYRIEEGRCAIYSVGPDRIDNDGAVFTELDKPYDVAFWLSFENPTPQVP